MLLTLYRRLTELGGPAIRLYLARRRAAGKEDAARQGERRGLPGRPRPPGPLVWCHAASVGESLSILVLVERLLAAVPDLHVLVTTGTVTSARLMAERLPARALHQYLPVDRPRYVRRFLAHWRPDLVLWTESEIWPNLLSEIGTRGIPAALVNARMSVRSYRAWRRVPGLARALLTTFRLCLAQSEAEAARLRDLGARDVRCVGNLKFSAPPLPADAEALAALTAALAGRPVWLLASSHPGEEEIALEVHAALAARLPGVLTVIVPRHPGRGAEIAALARRAGLVAARRSTGALPAPGDPLYIADTLGELGLFYRIAPVVWVGGSLVPHGGHNPIEPARLGCAVVYGPHMENFAEITAELEAAGGACRVADPAGLAEAVAHLLSDPAAHARQAAAGRAVAERNRQAADRVLAALAPLLVEAGIPVRP